MTNLNRHITDFLLNLQPPQVPEGVVILNPYKEADVKTAVSLFYTKYYDDQDKRYLILGINPGRFGAGITGISFTDPIRLEKDCGITNPFKKRAELSSAFIYEMIDKMGGSNLFYKHFYIGSVSPFGFMQDGKNLNYYDRKDLQEMLEGFISESIIRQVDFGMNREVCFCIGEGKNFNYLDKLNKRLKLFDEIIPLSHPRYVMQYKRKQKESYLNKFTSVLNSVS